MAIRDNIPEFIANIPAMADLTAAEQPEIDRIEGKAEATLGEFFVGTFTATTADTWERLVGYEPAPGWDIARRRERVRSRLLSTSPMTPAMLKEIIESMAMTTIDLTEDADNYKLNVKFVGIYGVSPYIDDVKAEIERIRPYHLQVIYEWVYAQHKQIGDFTHAQLAGYTQDAIRNGGILNGTDN